ncbi:hypothetical protein glysoja_021595 [Glycine soja]|nr:hypothetical protein glysoja_021595 [Glycine soja]
MNLIWPKQNWMTVFASLLYQLFASNVNEIGVWSLQGGPTGVELAGARLTLVHKGARLLEFVGAKAEDKTLNWLKSKNVVVKLEQSVDLNAFTDG